MGTLTIFCAMNSRVNVKKTADSIRAYLNDDTTNIIPIDTNKKWGTLKISINMKTKIPTFDQLSTLCDVNANVRPVIINLLVAHANIKPLDSYYIVENNLYAVLQFDGLTESESSRLSNGRDVSLTSGVKFLTNKEFIEVLTDCAKLSHHIVVSRCLFACAFQYMKHRRFTPKSKASDFMVKEYFPFLEANAPESAIIDFLTDNPEITLSEDFLLSALKMCGHK